MSGHDDELEETAFVEPQGPGSEGSDEGEESGFGVLDDLLRNDAPDVALDGSDYAAGYEAGDEFDEDAEYLSPPVHWPTLEAEEAAERMEALWPWVQELQKRRFPEMYQVPSCWPHHRSLVELMQALFDHERASFAPVAPPTAAVGWHLVLRDIEARLRDFGSNLECGDRRAESHRPPARLPAPEEAEHLQEWLRQQAGHAGHAGQEISDEAADTGGDSA